MNSSSFSSHSFELYGAATPKQFRVSSSNFKIDSVIVIKFLKPKGHQNCIRGSKVAYILLKGWILPIGGSSTVHNNFVSSNKFNKTTATFRWPLCSMCLHTSLQIISALLPCSNSAPHSLQLNGISSRILPCALYCRDFCGSIYTQKWL